MIHDFRDDELRGLHDEGGGVRRAPRRPQGVHVEIGPREHPGIVVDEDRAGVELRAGSDAAAGLAGSTFMRSFLDFDFINLAITPMFLFSATFFPLDQYPGWLAVVVQLTPLYQGVALCRALTTGEVDPGLLLHVAYLVAMVAVGVRVAGRRIDQLLRA